MTDGHLVPDHLFRIERHAKEALPFAAWTWVSAGCRPCVTKSSESRRWREIAIVCRLWPPHKRAPGAIITFGHAQRRPKHDVALASSLVRFVEVRVRHSHKSSAARDESHADLRNAKLVVLGEAEDGEQSLALQMTKTGQSRKLTATQLTNELALRARVDAGCTPYRQRTSAPSADDLSARATSRERRGCTPRQTVRTQPAPTRSGRPRC